MSGRFVLTKLFNRHLLSHSRASYCSSASTQWDIFASVCVERLPVVTPPLNEMQNKYKKFLDKIEMQNSFKSDHEVRHEKDLANAAKLKNENLTDLDEVAKETAQDFEDACNDEFAKFTFAPIETESDKKKDQKSLERSLRSHLVLLVEQNLGGKKMFILPQGKLAEGETLRQTAERVFKETCGDTMNVRFYSNAPCGYYRYKYKSPEGSRGVKMFFYYAEHISGQVSKGDFKWLTRNELETSLLPKYYDSVNEFLLDERP